MSSLYRMMYGERPESEVILQALKITRTQTGRYRDCWIENNEIAVYTRNGGNNRKECRPVLDALKTHPHYLRDVDDDYDNTYCTIYFRIPEEQRIALSCLKHFRNR